jgi:transcriptional regulator with XRE-family HTH domain
MVDIDETTLSKIVNGFRQPTPEVRGRIAAALESDEDWLFENAMEAPAAPQGVRHDHSSPQGRVTRRNRASVGL